MRGLRLVTMAGVVLLLSSGTSSGQGRQSPPPRPQAQAQTQMPGVTPAEIQQLIDALELTEAEATLQLSDEQYPRFLNRLRRLQAVRRTADLERTRALNELRRMTQAGDPQFDDRIRQRLQDIAAIDERAFTEEQEALVAVNEVLDLRQQALFRIFEEQMERRKADLLVRARQGNRAANRFE